METYELLTVPLMSLEYEGSPYYREIKVRIWHDDAGGMQAEPIAWWLKKPRKDLPDQTVTQGGPPRFGSHDAARDPAFDCR